MLAAREEDVARGVLAASDAGGEAQRLRRVGQPAARGAGGGQDQRDEQHEAHRAGGARKKGVKKGKNNDF